MKERMSERILRGKGQEREDTRREAAVLPLEDARQYLGATERWFFETCAAAADVPAGALGHWMSAYRLYKKACFDDLRRVAALHGYDAALLETGRGQVAKHLGRVQTRFFDQLDEFEARVGRRSALAERFRTPIIDEDAQAPDAKRRGSFARSLVALLAFGTATAASIESTDTGTPAPPATAILTDEAGYIDAPLVSALPERTIQDLIDHPPAAGPLDYELGATRPPLAEAPRMRESVHAAAEPAPSATPEGGAAPSDTVEPEAEFAEEAPPTTP